MHREHTKQVWIGGVPVGGGAPIAVQSMTNTKTEDVAATVAQIHRLEQAGCQIIRCAVPTMEAAKALRAIREQISIPLVADIHFDYKLAIAAMENGPGFGRGRKSARFGGSDSRRRQQRFTGKKSGGEIRRRHRGGFGAERSGAGQAA